MSNRKRSRKKQSRWPASRVLVWVGLACLAGAVVIVGFFAFSGGGGEPRRALRQEPVVSEEPAVTVEVVDNDFEPRELTVRPGTEVTWKFEGDAAHDVTEDRGAFSSGTMDEGDEYVLTFEDAGTYYYYCTLHHAMQGTLIVAAP